MEDKLLQVHADIRPVISDFAAEMNALFGADLLSKNGVRSILLSFFGLFHKPAHRCSLQSQSDPQSVTGYIHNPETGVEVGVP